jgi:FkbM family methyltransferase
MVSANSFEPKRLGAIRAAFAARPGGDFIDVGAWIGVGTLYAGALGAGKIVALETDPVAFDELWANVALNAGVAARTWAYRQCVSDRAESRAVTTVLGSTNFAAQGFVEAKRAAGEALSTYDARCVTFAALADAHGVTAASAALVAVNTVPGMELVIAGDLHDWVKAAPAGADKPSIWLTLHTHKWGDKALGHHALMPLVRLYKFKYTAHLNPLDLELVERRGEGPCPSEYNTCHILLTDWELKA